MSLKNLLNSAASNVGDVYTNLTSDKNREKVTEGVKDGVKLALGVGAIAGKTATEVGKATKEKLGELTDNIAGTAAQERIEALVLEQRRYNDILATQLSLALDRIAKLEKIVAKLSK